MLLPGGMTRDKFELLKQKMSSGNDTPIVDDGGLKETKVETETEGGLDTVDMGQLEHAMQEMILETTTQSSATAEPVFDLLRKLPQELQDQTWGEKMT